MDQEMTFPNPTPRPDLKPRRRKKPYVIAAVVILFVLGVIFLPQLLGTKIGRRLVRSYLESKFSAEASVGEFHTHWFSGTSAEQCWIKLPDGRRIGFNSLTCDAGLLKFLRGHFDLGKTHVDAPFVEYMVNYGDGTDTASRIMGITPASPESAKPQTLPKISGEFTFEHGTISLERGVIDPQTLITTYSQTRFINVSGHATVTSLDAPWTFHVSGEPIGNAELPTADQSAAPGENAPAARINISGSAKLGENGILDATAMQLDIAGDGRDVPLASIGPICYSPWTYGDFAQALGSHTDQVQFKLTGSDGKIHLMASFASPAASGNFDSDFDLTSAIGKMTLAGTGNTLRLRSSAALDSHVLAYFNPFLADAAPGGGAIDLRFHSLTLPLSLSALRNGDGVVAGGTMQVRGAPLIDADALADASQRSLITEWLELTGQMPQDKPLTIEQPPTPFNISGGQASAEADQVSIGATRITLTAAGNLQGAGSIKDLATIRSAPKLAQLVTSPVSAATEPSVTSLSPTPAAATIAPAPTTAGAGLQSLVIDIKGTAAAAHIDFEAFRQSLNPALAPRLADFIDANATELRNLQTARDIQAAPAGPMSQ